jgi:hypothetical protein
MEPLNDHELRDLLERWDAPAAPASLERRIFGEPERQPWYRWLFSGSIRVPVPVAAALLLLLWSAWTFLGPRRSSTVAPVAHELTFSDFQPVKELKPRVVQGNYEAN